MNTVDFVTELAKLRPGASFMTLKSYRNEHGEVADYSIVFHISYHSALQRSLDKLEVMTVDTELEKQAKEELTHSLRNSLMKQEEQPIEEREDAYLHFSYDGEPVRGVKLHVESNTLHLYGSVVHKRVLLPGIYKKVNSKPLTIAKNKMQSLLPISKFRQFKILPEQVESIAVGGLELLPPNNG